MSNSNLTIELGFSFGIIHSNIHSHLYNLKSPVKKLSIIQCKPYCQLPHFPGTSFFSVWGIWIVFNMVTTKNPSPDSVFVSSKMSNFAWTLRKRNLRNYYLVLPKGFPLRKEEIKTSKSSWTHTSQYSRDRVSTLESGPVISYINYTVLLCASSLLPGELALPSPYSHKRTSASQGRDSQEFMTQSTHPKGA